MSATLTSLVPATVAVVESDDFAAAALLPEEDAMLGIVAEKRRRDFTLGRECARQALRKLGVLPRPILRGPAREPLWPPGLCGSITHCNGYCAAVAARQVHIRGIGIDAESRQTLPEGILPRISLDSERAWIRKAEAGAPWDVILFSAKESVFKAWYPAVGSWIGFEHARIEFDPSAGNFLATILPHAPGATEERIPRQFTGRFHFDGKRVLTSALIPASLPQSPPAASE